MKRIMKVIGITLLAGSLLVACNSEEGTGTTAATNGDRVDDGNEIDEGIDNEEDDSNVNDEAAELGESGGELGSDQEFGDQLDLGIGDTAQLSSNQGAYEITIDSIKKEKTIDGESPMFDYFIIVDLTVKNIGDSVLDVTNPVGILEQTIYLDVSGSNDMSQNFESIDALTGELQPGEQLSGEALFSVREGEREQYIRVQPGLMATGGVYNEAVWTFTEDEME